MGMPMKLWWKIDKQKGLKPRVVEVTTRGWIDGACDGKHVLDHRLRSIVPHVLDVFISKDNEGKESFNQKNCNCKVGV
jgi:hypothetical protein